MAWAAPSPAAPCSADPAAPLRCHHRHFNRPLAQCGCSLWVPAPRLRSSGASASAFLAACSASSCPCRFCRLRMEMRIHAPNKEPQSCCCNLSAHRQIPHRFLATPLGWTNEKTAPRRRRGMLRHTLARAQVHAQGQRQEEVLRAEPGNRAALPSFPAQLQAHGLDPVLRRREISTVQINIGLYCNQACAHCHVDSSPQRTEMMDRRTAQRIVDLISECPQVGTVDLTGGAPELNPQFRFLVQESRRMGKEVIDRCNLTVLSEPGQEDLAHFLQEHRVRVVASLPCYSPSNVDKQRGRGVFERSIDGLTLLNSLGYGQEGSGLLLDLVYNPVGPTLPPSQASLELAYKSELGSCYGIVFNRLLTITNMPINRFQADLQRKGALEEYMELLVASFNARAIPELMCTNLLNIGWDGTVYDCDFNQQLGLQMPLAHQQQGNALTVFDIASLRELQDSRVAVGSHCFGCTAGEGSSCTGAIAVN